MADDVLMSEDEVRRITDYKRPAEQLTELHRQGFWRARRAAISGRVILERAHYEAVASGSDTKPTIKRPTPQLRLA